MADDGTINYWLDNAKGKDKTPEKPQKPKKTIPPSWTKEDLKRQEREKKLFKLGYEQGKQDAEENWCKKVDKSIYNRGHMEGFQTGKRAGAKSEKERILKFMESISMGSPEEDLKQYWKLREKLKKEVNPL